MSDQIEAWCARVREAAASGQPIRIRGGGTKDFYGQHLAGEVLDTRAHAGVVSYEPTELVVTARAGTPLAELERVLAEQGQMLGFEPPHFGEGATVGGCVAAGLSGPRRATAGAVRDFVLGVRVIDGRGEALHFGGEVMKNVAGYDVSRLMAGSLGTLALITEVSFKVLPRPAAEITLQFEMEGASAIEIFNEWAGEPLPVSATAWCDGQAWVRLSGAEAAVAAAARQLGGDRLEPAAAEAFWRGLREQRHDFFAAEAPLWRLSLPSVTPPLGLGGARLIEWGGAQRWFRCEERAGQVREQIRALGGHATLFRGGDRAAGVFHPLDPVMDTLQARLKHAFDPAGIFGPGRLYDGR
ncbi:glycolate oxidase subunit GlcE [Nitrogeniibacter mangrovi]|uniref:Glycolate oxidase subunit GlcE n=1 Tax=Nitrogeniibacter mangrovi TaxID=2016596 RepID=A0A6C1B6Y0_9RHOO|nr:glycolate oxidase subunit GlcE [Nitrogeniibacter mangrovi]QID18719.1 glycolate oxidase subunit GlcE [Nitrogeniibacter mangrovi]